MYMLSSRFGSSLTLNSKLLFGGGFDRIGAAIAAGVRCHRGRSAGVASVSRWSVREVVNVRTCG